MSLAQLHYTSATGGDGPGTGEAEPIPARFTAVDAAIPASVLTEAGPLLAYRTPAGTEPRLTDAALRALPEALSFSVLTDGSHLLARTVAVRPGPGSDVGFHAHAVHLPAGTRLPDGALPITACRSARWAATTPDRMLPGPLAAPPATGHARDREGLNDFAVSRGPWLAGVLADLRRLYGHDGSGRVVLVERQSADVARWIALACVALPGELAERLTFTTYTRHPRRAPQQIVGVLPQDAHELTAPGFHVHTCTGPRPEGTVADAWAETAARIWRSRAPELFREAAELPGEPFAAGPVAVTALCAGIALGTGGRAAAAGWAAERPYALDAKRTRQLVDALTAPGVDDRTGPEFDAAGRLFAALDGRSPATTTAPLAAMLVTEAVRGGNGSVELPGRTAFSGPEGAAVASVLGPEILTELSGAGVGLDVARTVQLLRVARLLGVDCAELLPAVVRRLAPALLQPGDGEPGWAPALLELMDEQFDVRTALLGALDRIAPQDPSGVERLLCRVPLPFTGTQSLPHLRMCAEAPEAKAGCGADRVGAVQRVLRAAGMSPFAEPLVLRTAVGLVWEEGTVTAGEARLLLEAATSDAHRTAGTWSHLVAAALGAPATDEEAPELAHDLLRGFPQEIAGRERGALLLLEFAREIRSDAATPEWAERARTLRRGAEPVEPEVLGHAYGALATRLLAPDRPEAELYALVHSGDPDLVAAYDRAAREAGVRSRLKAEPAYAADCFAVWTAHPHAGAEWSRTADALLEEVLRPAVRTLSAEEVAAVEEAVGRSGSSGRAEAFHDWNRRGRGTLGRISRRIAGRVRRG
ncbi:GTPase-associated protein 1-related protein [Streptomyces poriferorum]|uniref:GTPase-associated protein 1-related protein n=1 Tax=Streptomyces poriferorum TaxID=2798799 RepID=A0ABY9IJW3_9ACTN|nr:MULTISPECIES: GTPase-associated protein 1-related protein [unclassified Streptomyces]MDP5317260.1 GTPase-associated protein 1-related protein [Streptomyces sp. Alt4]WLQ55521.1 GTPase-associated protein 1-related protein [Streptomyces sp. Alt2]